jgi:hypothetical protein
MICYLSDIMSVNHLHGDQRIAIDVGILCDLLRFLHGNVVGRDWAQVVANGKAKSSAIVQVTVLRIVVFITFDLLDV